jgi:3-hydroxyisobutyrate dehydrogenase
LKDLNIALEEAEKMRLQLPGVSQARKLYKEMIDSGRGRLGIQALFQLYMAGV